MNRYALALVLLGCTKEVPVVEPVRPLTSAVSSATPPVVQPAATATATAKQEEPPKEPETITCFTNMPEQSCSIGCDAEDSACARSCAFACDKCTKETCADKDDAAREACEAKCIAAKDRCTSGDCAKKNIACERTAALEAKKSYGCKTKDLGAACDEIFSCLAACQDKKNCDSICEKQTGCDAYFQRMVSWNGCFPFHDGGVP